MARKPKREKLNVVGSGNLSHDNTKNALSEDQVHALTLHHKSKFVAALSAKKKAGAEFLNVTKLIKAELGDNGLADIKDMIASEEDGFEEKLQAELERKARLGRWLGLSLGAQGNLFEQTTTPSQQERGFAEGKRAGLANEICKPPFDAGTDGYDGYMRGWHEGNAVRTNMAKEQDEGGVLLRREGNEPAGADEFDSASEGQGGGDPKWPDDAAIESREAQPA